MIDYYFIGTGIHSLTASKCRLTSQTEMATTARITTINVNNAFIPALICLSQTTAFHRQL